MDELNRATPKAQAALLEAMQRQVIFEGKRTRLAEPFIVLATQMPFGTPGTCPLSEVRADRFAFSVLMGYPSAKNELKVISTSDAMEAKECQETISPQQVIRSTTATCARWLSRGTTLYRTM